MQDIEQAITPIDLGDGRDRTFGRTFEVHNDALPSERGSEDFD